MPAVDPITLSFKQPALVFLQTADSTAIANTTDEAAFDQKFEIAASKIAAGDKIIARWQGIAGVTGTPTLTLKTYWGTVAAGTALLATPAVQLTSTGLCWTVDLNLVFRSTTSVIGHMRWIFQSDTATWVHGEADLVATTIVTTAATELNLSADWSAASASNTTTLNNCSVEFWRYGI